VQQTEKPAKPGRSGTLAQRKPAAGQLASRLQPLPGGKAGGTVSVLVAGTTLPPSR